MRAGKIKVVFEKAASAVRKECSEKTGNQRVRKKSEKYKKENGLGPRKRNYNRITTRKKTRGLR